MPQLPTEDADAAGAAAEVNVDPNDPASDVLAGLPGSGGRVALMYLQGSLNPVTLGHVQMLVEGRKLLLDADVCGERFDAVIAVVSVNRDGWVQRKLTPEQQHLFFNARDRSRLVAASTEDYPWIFAKEEHEEYDWWTIEERFPQHTIVRYMVNGADDVVKYTKWRYLSIKDYDERFITIGRPGHTHKVKSALKKRIAEKFSHTPELAAQRFLIGPELPAISSTAAREAALRNDRQALLQLLHPIVADALLALAAAGPRPDTE